MYCIYNDLQSRRLRKENTLPKNADDFPDEITTSANIVSFVVRVWREDSADDEEKEIWRGHITPLPDGARHYFTDFNDIPAVMHDYLKSGK
jgi:hypothetical protein